MKLRSTLLFLGLLIGLFGCTPSPTLSTLAQKIQSQLESQPGAYAIAFMDLTDTTRTILINEHKEFHAASTMKTPVMIEVYKQAEEGKLQLSDSVLVKDSFYSIVDSSIYQMDVNEDSEAKLYQLIGQKTTLYHLVRDMITYSSNLATNIVIDLVDAKKVTQTMRDLGAPDIQVLRGVEDIKAYELGMSNTTTAYDLMQIFKHLGQRTAVKDPEANQQMIDILLEQQFNEQIPALLPDEVKVAHKTGWISTASHDSGLVILPDGRQYVLVMLSKNWTSSDDSMALFAEISKQIYDFYTSN